MVFNHAESASFFERGPSYRTPPRASRPQLGSPSPGRTARSLFSSTAGGASEGLASVAACGRAAVFDIFSDEFDWVVLATDEANVVLKS